MPTYTSASGSRLIIPALGRIYAGLTPLAETVLRVAAGGILVVHGAGKITDPLANVGMVESLGFYPGALWATLLAVTEFVGGFLIAIGLLTRPAAAAEIGRAHV